MRIVRLVLNVAVAIGVALLSLIAPETADSAEKKQTSEKSAKAPRAPRAPRPQVRRPTKSPVQQRATKIPEPQKVTDHHLTHAHVALQSVRKTLHENAARMESRLAALERERAALKLASDAEREAAKRQFDNAKRAELKVAAQEKLDRLNRERAAKELALDDRLAWTKRDIARSREIERSLERREKTLVAALRYRRFAVPTVAPRFLSPYELLASVTLIEKTATVLDNTDRDYGGNRVQAIADLKDAALEIQATSTLRLHQGVRVLESVKRTLEMSGTDFGDLRAKTLTAVKEADRCLRKAIEAQGDELPASTGEAEPLSIPAMAAASGILDAVAAHLRKSENDFGGFRDPSVGALRDVAQALTTAANRAKANSR